MNVGLPKSFVSALTIGTLMLLLSTVRLFGQSGSPYGTLQTLSGTAVADTITGLNLDINIVSPLASHGSLALTIISSGGGSNPYVYEIRYTPDPGFIGIDTFTLELQYIGNYPYLIYRAFQVKVLPSLIDSKGDYAVTNSGSPVLIDVLANDNGSDGPFNLGSLPLVSNGTAAITGPGQIEFTPEPGFTGIAHIHYVLCDAAGNCGTEQIEVGVHANQAPPNDSLTVATTPGTAVRIPLTYNGFTVFQPPANGLVQLSANGQVFEYKPNAGYTGMDHFILQNTQYGQPFYKTIFADVLNVPSPNHMAVDDYVYTPVGQPVAFNVRDNDIGNLTVKNWSIPANLPGTVSGTTGSGNVTFTPDPNFSGIATFYYKIGNMFVPDLEIAAVNVIVSNENPVQGTYNFTTPTETPFVVNYKIPFSGFNFSLNDLPDHGVCNFYPGYSTQTINGQTVTGNNLLIYTPNTGFTGTDEFEISYCVNANGQCNDVKISMTVTDIYSTQAPYCVDDCVWAGDLNNDGIVNNRDLLPLGYAMGTMGMLRDDASLEWYGQFSDNWYNPFAGVPFDLKHADTDGNGQVTADDTLAIGLFYGQTHSFTPAQPVTNKGMPFFLRVKSGSFKKGEHVKIEVALGNQDFPVANLYGFTFDVTISPNIVDSALSMRFYDNNWMNRNSPSLWLAKTPTDHRLETAFTRTNGEPASGYGPVAEFEFIIIDIVHGGKSPEQDLPFIKIQAPQILWADGHTTTCPDYTLTLPFSRSELPTETAAAAPDFQIFPSPAHMYAQVRMNGPEQIEHLELRDVTGRVLFQSGAMSASEATIPVSGLAAGIYFVSVHTGSGIGTRKIEVVSR